MYGLQAGYYGLPGGVWGIVHSISLVLEEYQGSLCWVRPSSPLQFAGKKCLQISASSSKSGTLNRSKIFYHSFREEKWKYQKELVTSLLYIYMACKLLLCSFPVSVTEC